MTGRLATWWVWNWSVPPKIQKCTIQCQILSSGNTSLSFAGRQPNHLFHRASLSCWFECGIPMVKDGYWSGAETYKQTASWITDTESCFKITSLGDTEMSQGKLSSYIICATLEHHNDNVKIKFIFYFLYICLDYFNYRGAIVLITGIR